MKQAMVLVTVLAVTTLAGCLEGGSGDGVPIFGSVESHGLEPGYFQFTHRGGALVLEVPSDNYASFDLFNGQDQRLGRIELGDGGFADQLSIDGAAGEYVLNLIELHVVRHGPESAAPDGEPQDAEPEEHDPEELVPELTITSGGREVTAFLPLGLHVERHLLVATSFQTNSGMPIVGVQGRGDPLDKTVELDLVRAPTEIRLLATGYAESLEITGRGSGGLVFESGDSYDAPFAYLEPLGRMFYPQNVVDNQLSVQLTANEQEGPIVLEAYSYSRYQSGEGAGARILVLENPGDDVVFTYGEVPKSPTRIELSDKAQFLQAWTEDAVPSEGSDPDCEEGEACSGSLAHAEPIVAWFTVFDPQDVRIGTFKVESGQRLEIPLDMGGGYVIRSVSGPVTIGTDAAPRDFEMHPMETRVHELGSESPGERNSYGHVSQDINLTGVPYMVEPVLLGVEPGFEDFLLFGECADEGSILLSASGETIGFAGDHMMNTMAQANRNLPTSGLMLTQYGFDGNCGQIGLAVYTYQR